MAEAQSRIPLAGRTPVSRPVRWRLSMSSVLSLCFGSLITVSLLLVLGITVNNATRSTIDLLRKEAELGISLITGEIENHLSSARIQTAFVARILETGGVDVDDSVRLESLMVGAMAADPAIGGLVFVFPDGEAAIVDRLGDPARFYRAPLADDPVVRSALESAREGGGPQWIPPTWRPDYERTILTLLWPVWRDGEFLGVLASTISIQRLSERLKTGVGDFRSNVFTLYGKDRVLAHSLMAEDYPGLSLQNPLPSLSSFQDPGLAGMWNPETMRPTRILLEAPLLSHSVEIDGTDFVFVYREIGAYTTVPLLVGAYFESEVVSGELDRLRNSILIGLAAILISVFVAVIVGRRLARPVKRLSAAAQLVSQMNLDGIDDLPPSRVIELDHQSEAFNAMRGALKWFQAYVPRALVNQLIKAGDMTGLESDSRNITVMFTDIAGYSTVSEGKNAAEIARMLNHHFSILTEEIEAEGGTVDKFIGDSVMAFWGAPEKQKNRAIRACRAALAIRRRIEEDNRERTRDSQPPIRVRIGIHSGQATAANIGSPTRLNYTVIGDTVNVAQRLEQLGKEVSPDAEVATVISAETALDTGNEFDLAPAGRMTVKGRTVPVEVFSLIGTAR